MVTTKQKLNVDSQKIKKGWLSGLRLETHIGLRWRNRKRYSMQAETKGKWG